MSCVSENKFLNMRDVDFRDTSLNAFLFSDFVPEDRVTYEDLSAQVHHILAVLCFNVHLSGFRYLAKLVRRYIVNPDSYDEDAVIKEIAEDYDVSAAYVVDNIRESIEINCDLLARASFILDIALSANDFAHIHDVVEMLFAVYRIYYNCTVEDNSRL